MRLFFIFHSCVARAAVCAVSAHPTPYLQAADSDPETQLGRAFLGHQEGGVYRSPSGGRGRENSLNDPRLRRNVLNGVGRHVCVFFSLQGVSFRFAAFDRLRRSSVVLFPAFGVFHPSWQFFEIQKTLENIN